ncbi:hypothetical protein [Acidilobus saccharovorans]|uniref:hypothetical protein n=1 Tax=Acidilobus saccharovorans TaxID=242703 RepID=UPI0006624937|nr:hypothetical protein [Acidilobus saccharovorans]
MFGATLSRCRYGHGSAIITRGLLFGVEIGLQSPPGFIPIIPKYVPCDHGKWGRPGAKLCRVIESYGPGGVAKAFEGAGLKLLYDPAYSSYMPYIPMSGVLVYISPKEALRRALSGGSPLVVELARAAHALSRAVGSADSLGLTGSFAMEIEQSFSDIDFVVYGAYEAAAAFEFFTKSLREGECKEDFGGVRLRGFACLEWRRGLLDGVNVPISWVGVPEGPASACRPLSEYNHIEPPARSYANVLTIQPYQESALLYPPCVSTEEGVTIVSFEYNLGGYLYMGGEVFVDGLATSDGKVVYVGTRERPGGLTLIRQFKP